MVKVYNSSEILEPVYENRELHEGELVCYRGWCVNGTGATEVYCYVSEVISKEEKTYKVSEIRYPKSFDKSYTPPKPREYIVEDLDPKAMCEKIGQRLGYIECLTKIAPRDVVIQYEKPWKQILECNKDLRKLRG
jgi:NTP pyrophosphatase (non-canonical NTP hydrolase)